MAVWKRRAISAGRVSLVPPPIHCHCSHQDSHCQPRSAWSSATSTCLGALFFLIIITKHIMIPRYHLPDCRHDIALPFLQYRLVVFSLKMESQQLYSIKRSSTGHLPLMLGRFARGKPQSTARPTAARSSSQIRGTHCMVRDLTLTASPQPCTIYLPPSAFASFCSDLGSLQKIGLSDKVSHKASREWLWLVRSHKQLSQCAVGGGEGDLSDLIPGTTSGIHRALPRAASTH